jgi:hypothetical protein
MMINKKTLTATEVAIILSKSVGYFNREIKLSPYFPKPIVHVTASGRVSHPTWHEDDIINYMNDRRIAA